MALLPTLRASGAGCSACRTSVVRLFISPYAPVIQTAVRQPWTSPSLLLQRTLSVGSSRLYSTQTTFTDQGKETEINTLEEEGNDENPWYLEEEPPRHPTLVSQVQPLPEIPKGSPTIIHDLVPYVAEDIGLDDLNLMDLRSLDPPAALGPSLIMLFGTARSERHLNVSAGRLRAWLRTKGINAHADGLLGPNEFKIKMRRKMRKAKLLGTSAMPLGSDDGITSRWICMNLGTIGSTSQDEMEFQTIDGRVTGFGIEQTGTTIVVQMFTESKRKELDLETLWSRILARKGNKGHVKDDLEYAEADAHPDEVSLFTEGGLPKVLATPFQRRFFSTSSRRLSPLDNYTQVTDPSDCDLPANTVDTYIDPVNYLSARKAKLDQLQTALVNLTRAEALEALEHSNDGNISIFLRDWDAATKDMPPEQSWRFRLWLCVFGRQLGLPRFSLGLLRDLLNEMELYGIICDRDEYLQMLQSVYQEPKGSEALLESQSKLALDILNAMFERGEPIITTDVITSLIESIARSEIQSEQQRQLQTVLEKFILQAELPYMGENALIRLLAAYAAQDNWERFWEVWRMPPKHLTSRSEEMYVFLWNTIAATNHQRLCREAIRSYFHEMLNESTPVKLTVPIKEALKACIRVADPKAEAIAETLVVQDWKTETISLKEFVHLFRVLNDQHDGAHEGSMS